MRLLEAPRRGGRQRAFLLEVDRDPVRVEQRGDVLDRGLERVSERQARDRLTDNRQERPAPLELHGQLARAARGTQGMGGTNCEAGNRCELLRCAAGSIEKLEDADRRLTESKHDERSLGQLVHRGRLLVEHDRLGGSGRRREVGRPGVQTVEDDAFRRQQPEQRSVRLGGHRRDPRDMSAGLPLVRGGGKRVACELEDRTRRSVASLVAAELGREQGEIGREGRELPLRRVEFALVTKQLEHAELPVRRVELNGDRRRSGAEQLA